MTDIIIKSFNRPYYLARCLESIYKLVSGNFRITVLDDGTPPVYLDKVKTIYPEIKIVVSASYPEKVKAIEDHVWKRASFKATMIPVKLWITQVSQSSDLFLLLEDDIWITERIDLDQMVAEMAQHSMAIAKIGWSGNKNVNQGTLKPVSNYLEIITPKLPVNSKIVYDALALNRFKIRSVLFRLGLVNERFNLPYYSLYAVAAAVFNKSYWLSLWENAGSQVNESEQLSKALHWKNRYLNDRFGKTKAEMCKTSYITSATNSFPGIALDMIVLNHHLNEAWLGGTLDAMNNYPGDFDVAYLKKFLSKINDERCSPANWDKWITRFKDQYIKMGCDVG